MRTPSHGRRSAIGFNMTPMIDVVFLLIIFFLVSSNLAQQEVQLDLELPTAQSGTQGEETDVRRVVVNVLPDGRLQVGTETLEIERLGDMLRYESVQTQGDVEVRIRTARNVPYGTIEPILLACVPAGIWNVSFAVFAE